MANNIQKPELYNFVCKRAMITEWIVGPFVIVIMSILFVSGLVFIWEAATSTWVDRPPLALVSFCLGGLFSGLIVEISKYKTFLSRHKNSDEQKESVEDK